MATLRIQLFPHARQTAPTTNRAQGRALSRGLFVAPVPPTRTAHPTVACRARGKFTQDQLDFLERKKTGKMPYTCTECAGCGETSCPTCSATGVNQAGLAERLFDLEHGVHRRAPDINVNYLFMEEMPCFICKGRGSCPCPSCSGTGIADFATKFSPSD